MQPSAKDRLIVVTCISSAHVHVCYLLPGVCSWIVDFHTLPDQGTIVPSRRIQQPTENTNTCQTEPSIAKHTQQRLHMPGSATGFCISPRHFQNMGYMCFSITQNLVSSPPKPIECCSSPLFVPVHLIFSATGLSAFSLIFISRHSIFVFFLLPLSLHPFDTILLFSNLWLTLILQAASGFVSPIPLTTPTSNWSKTETPIWITSHWAWH